MNFDTAKQLLTQKITTSADVRIRELEQKRDAARQQFADETIQRAKETAEAWRSVDLHRKVKSADEAYGSGEEAMAFGGNGTGGYEDGGSLAGAEVSTAESVAGSARQIRNITVNIDAFNKGGINTTSTEGLNGMSATDIEEWFNQMLLRAIRNIELSY